MDSHGLAIDKFDSTEIMPKLEETINECKEAKEKIKTMKINLMQDFKRQQQKNASFQDKYENVAKWTKQFYEMYEKLTEDYGET